MLRDSTQLRERFFALFGFKEKTLEHEEGKTFLALFRPSDTHCSAVLSSLQ
jgi:hypothetical protein